MLTFSYTLFPTLKKEIENIDVTRNKILIELVPPSIEIRAKFENTARIIRSSLFLEGKHIEEREIVAILEGKKVKNEVGASVKSTYEALSFIRRSWLLSGKQVTTEAVNELIKIQKPDLKIERKQISDIVDFITVNPEHPIVQAGLAFILTTQLLPQLNQRIKLSINVSRMFLYNSGYDMRDMVNLEEYFALDLSNLEKIIKRSVDEKNISAFLEYFVQTLSLESEKVLDKIRNRKQDLNPSQLSILSERQKKILSLFDIPEIKVTNRIVQKEFNISQITASRDLARLATLGLIFTNGKGRSVFYTKI